MSGQYVLWSIAFFILALIASLAGAREIGGLDMVIAKWFVIIFTILAIIALIL